MTACVRSLLALVVATLLASTALLAQTPDAVLAGRVLSADDDAPLPFVSVVVEDGNGGAQVAGTLTSEDGRFLIRGLAPGSFRVRISFPGYQPADASLLVSPLNQAYDLGDIRLPRLEGFEEQVDVAGNASRAQGVDSQVYRLNEGPTTSTGTLLDALKNLPGITVDQEGRVLLRGSDRVAIVIDGRQSSLTGFGNQRGLDSVSAANVEAIEIINNPSARFDAAGMAGVINIIYKRDQEMGWSGDVGLNAGVGRLTRQRADLPTELGSFTGNGKMAPSLNLTYRTPRVRAFLQSEVLFQDALPNNEFTTRVYDDGRVIGSQVPENREQYHYTIRGGTDWALSPSTALTVSGVHDFERHIDRAQVPFILASTGQRERFWFWREEEDTGVSNATLDLRRRFAAPGHELGLNVQYTRGREDEAYFLNEVSSVRVGTDMTHLIATEHTLPVSVDYTRPLATGRLELGGRLQRRWIPVTYTVDRGEKSVIYEGLGDFSDWDEDIYAAYANLVRATPAYTLEAGLRLEQAAVRYTVPAENIYYPDSDAYDYFSAFPNAKLTYRLTGGHRLVAAYNRRVDRPGEPELRIFPKYDDPELLKVGNPYLRPQFTHAYEIGYGRAWAGGSLTASLYHRDISDAFLRVFAIDDSNPSYDIVNRLYQNAGNSRQTGVQVLVDHQVVTRWRAAANVNVFRNQVDAFETTLLFPTPRPFALAASRRGTWDATLNNRLQLPRGLEVQANIVYYAKRNVPQGRERARSSVDVSGRWPLSRDRVEVLFSVTDLFNDFGVQREIDGQGFSALYQNYMETQVATVGLRFRFDPEPPGSATPASAGRVAVPGRSS